MAEIVERTKTVTFQIARMSRAEFDTLPEYSATLPTGVTIGKKWKRSYQGHWLLGEHVACDDPDKAAVRWTNIQVFEPVEALARIAEIIEAIDNRCMAADGPVTPTSQAITEDELARIYALSKGQLESWRPDAEAANG